jgi:hypothetical protein
LENAVIKQLIFAMLTIFIASTAQGEAIKTIRFETPKPTDAVIENIAHVFARQIESRCEAKVVSQGEAELTVELAVEPGIGEEGFKIADGGKGTIRILGNDNRGILYGVGKFLHTSVYGKDGFTPTAWRGASVPKMPVRGMYFATHFQNFYHVAPIEDVQQYLEDVSLWGTNSFVLWFGMEEFNGIGDPKAQKQLDRLRDILKIAKSLGLNAALGCICNDGYRNSPAELRADSSTENRPTYYTKNGPRIYNLGNELCPSKPGVPEMELEFCREKFEAFKSVGLDYWFIWPYDNGGCTCPKCSPWGANGYLRMAEPLAKEYKKAFPGGKIVLGTWYFDRWGIGEWDGITAKFKAQKPDWVDYIMSDNFEEYPRYPLEKGVPGGFPLLNFPDISMYGQDPWGGYGANPHPGRLQQRWDETKAKLSGGFPYSEGIYEDVNKVICAQLYWNPDKPAIETVREYAAFEFSPEVADEVVEVVKLFEKNHYRNQIGESAVTAAEMVELIDAKLTPQARRAWRWRLFAIRAALDAELFRNGQGMGRQKVFTQACEELVKISRTENVWPMMKPILFTAVNVEGPNLAAGYSQAVVASKPAAWWRMNDFRDRQIEDASGKSRRAVYENAVALGPPSEVSSNAAKKPENRAACLAGGRIKAAIDKLPDSYSVEFWFYNSLPNSARPITGYLFSRGVEGPEGTPGDDLGVSGTSAVELVPPGRLFIYSGDATRQLFGKTEIAPETWNHVVFVRDGNRVAAYLNGNAAPEISGELAKGYPDGVTQLFLGGRNDNFGNLQGKIAEAAAYDRPLTGEEAARHYRATGKSNPSGEPQNR